MLHFPSPDIGLFGRRQRHPRGHRVPVMIVSNGAVTPQERDSAVVVDDLGADDVTLLGGGCRCCTVRSRLQLALRRLLAERAQGRHFARVVIDTGQDLGPILRTFATERALGADFYVGNDIPHADGTIGFTLTEGNPLSWNAFSRFMTTLMTLRGADLLHVKGVLNVAGCRGPVVLRVMQHLAHRPIELRAWPDDDRASRLVFITRGIQEKAVRGLFDAVRALA
jgi:G3E family GTPase